MEKPGKGDLVRGGGETGREEAKREGRERGKEREKEWENRKRERDRARRGKEEGRESMLIYVQAKAHQDRDPVTATPGVPNPHLLSTQTPRWLHAHHSRTSRAFSQHENTTPSLCIGTFRDSSANITQPCRGQQEVGAACPAPGARVPSLQLLA